MTHLLAATPQVLNISGIKTLLLSVVGIVIIIAAIVMAARAHSRNFAAILGSIAVIVAALLVLGLATGNHVGGLAADLANLIF